MSERYSNVKFISAIGGLNVIGKKIGRQDWEDLGAKTNSNSILMEKTTWYLRAIDKNQKFDIREYKIENDEHIVELSTNNDSTSNVTFTSSPSGWDVWGKESGRQDWTDLDVKTNNPRKCKNTTWHFQARNGNQRGDVVEKKISQTTIVNLPVPS